MSNNGIPPLDDWQADNYPVIFDEGASQLQYVKTGTKVDVPASSSYLVATVTLTDDQIKALPTTAIEIIPAPGVDKAIIIQNAYVYVKGSNYTNLDANGVAGLVWYPDIYFAMAMWRTIGFANLFGFGESIISPAIQESKVDIVTSPSVTFVQADFEGVVSGINNRAVHFYCTNGASGNFTGGNAANSMRIKVWYVVEDL